MKLDESATIPTRADDGAAGWDLYSLEDVEIFPGQLKIVKTGVAFAIPKGYVGLIWDRSGFSTKNVAHRYAGVIDSSYRGDVGVAIYNNIGVDYQLENGVIVKVRLLPIMDVEEANTIQIKSGDRIAQILFQEVVGEVEEVDTLDKTERGSGGFGSTGE